jgi:GDP-D-mannose dehydratase
MKAIIFGANGQDAFFLNALLEERGIEVLRVSRNNAPIIGNVSDYSIEITNALDMVFQGF